MKDKIKILANSKRSVNSENIDEYIFLELRRKEKDIFTNSFNNVFNLEDQFEKERNNSLKFCIYGTVESAYADCTDLTLEIKINDNALVTLALLIAESDPKDKELLINLTKQLISN